MKVETCHCIVGTRMIFKVSRRRRRFLEPIFIADGYLTAIILSDFSCESYLYYIQIGSNGSRRRREVQSVVMEQAASLHSLLLDAIDQFEDMDYTLTSLKD